MLKVNNKAELVEQVSKYKRVLALFSSSWCPFCQSFDKIFDLHVAKCSVDLVLRVNMDDYDSSLWDEYNIDAVPTLILFENGTIKSRLDAESKLGVTENKFIEWITNLNM
ncbi:MAG: thioredoxin family protein [Candidatus Bathyarchaeota archaeon]|nr:thioredoxin family protein [Candidatus Termiticorpusculum sp.]